MVQFVIRLRGCLAIAALLALLAMPAAAVAKKSPITGFGFISSFGSKGGGPGQFEGPYGIGIDPAGNVYVTDAGQQTRRVEKFSPTGKFLTQWGSYGSENGQFVLPFGVAAGAGGTIYVTDGALQRVQLFSPTGTFQSKFGAPGTSDREFGLATGIAIDATGDVYVDDIGNARIDKFDPTGKLITKWGSPGSGDGQFGAFTNYTFGFLALDASGDVFVTDSPNNRVEKFDSSGAYLGQWGSYGKSNGQFQSPNGIAVDPSGDVYVADEGGNRIEKFNSSGTFLAKFGSYGNANGELNGPNGIATNSAGDVFVVDGLNHRIDKFGPISLPNFLAGVSHDAKLGIASLTVNLPVPGDLKVSGRWISKPQLVPKVAGTSAVIRRPGPVTLKIRAKGRAERTLLRRGWVRVKIKVSFTPLGGTPTVQSKTLRLVRKPTGHS